MEQKTKSVLVVVDMQNDFISGSLGSAAAQAVVEPVCRKIRGFPGGVVFTMDTHMDNYLNTQEGRRLPVPHCVANTEGWAPNAQIWMALMDRNVADEAHMVCKDTFGAAELPIRIGELYGRDVEEIVLIGLCTDICVISNAMLLKAFFTKARIVVDAACCAGVTQESHDTALDAMTACHIDIENRR